MLKALEAFLAHLTDVNIGDNGTDDAENHNRQDVVADIVDLDGSHAGHDHQIKGKAGDAVHLIVIDVIPVHHIALAQKLDDRLDQHRGQRCPQEVKAPGDAVRKFGKDAQQAHEAKGDGIGQSNKARLDRELIHGFAVRNLIAVGIGLINHFAGRPGIAHVQIAALFIDVDIEHAEHGRHNKADGCQRQAKASVAGKLGGSCVCEVNIPAQRIAGTLTKSKGQDQAADIGNNFIAIAGQQEQNQGNTQANKGLQHIAAALQRAKFKHLCFIGLVRAFFGF